MRTRYRTNLVGTFACIFLPVFIFTQVGCSRFSRDAHRGQSSTLYTESEEWEIEDGQRIHEAIVATHYLYTKEDVGQYVTEVGRRVAQFAHRKHLPYRFTILVDERVYSTSAPGGFVYITTGLLDFLDNESELAAVLAHEIGEIQEPRKEFSRFKEHTEDLAAFFALVGPLFGPIGALSAAGIVLLTTLPVEESEIDRLFDSDEAGMEMLIRSGYDPQGLLDVLHRVKVELEADEMLLSDWQERRPASEERIASAERYFGGLDLSHHRLLNGYTRYQAVTNSVGEVSSRF